MKFYAEKHKMEKHTDDFSIAEIIVQKLRGEALTPEGYSLQDLCWHWDGEISYCPGCSWERHLFADGSAVVASAHGWAWGIEGDSPFSRAGDGDHLCTTVGGEGRCEPID